MGQVALVSSSPEETEKIAARLAAVLGPGDVVTVSGELGAGKTTFVRGAAHALGVAGPITSPTFTIGHRYNGVSHLDLYRFERFTEADWAALEPYFEDAVVFVEWPEAAAGRLPQGRPSLHRWMRFRVGLVEFRVCEPVCMRIEADVVPTICWSWIAGERLPRRHSTASGCASSSSRSRGRSRRSSSCA